MTRLPKETSHADLVKRFRELGWTGPQPGVGPHPLYMEKDGYVASIPNPHRKPIREPLLKSVLANAGITHSDWMEGKRHGRRKKRKNDRTGSDADGRERSDRSEGS